MPSLDLTLTDARPTLVARRVLAPRDFGAAAPSTCRRRRSRRCSSCSTPASAARHRLHASRSSTPDPDATRALSWSSMPALICGSLAFDTITTFPGPLCAADPARAGAHPERLVPGADAAARVRRLRRQHRLHLKLLGGEPLVHGRARQRRRTTTWSACAPGASTPSSCASSRRHYTAQAIIITDPDNNQITAFHPGRCSRRT